MIPGCLIIKFTITQNAQYRNHFHNVLCLSEAKGMDIKMKYIKDGIPQYPSLQDFHFEEDCMDILERWEQLFDKKPKRKREWKER